MGFLVFVLFITVLWLWSKMSSADERMGRTDDQLISAKDQIAALTTRVLHLERSRIERPVPPVVPASVPTPESAPAAATPPAPAPALAPESVPQPFVAEPTVAIPIEAPVPTPLFPVQEPVGASAFSITPAGSLPRESWELTVGTSWLNKIGVLVSIVGVALLVSYSFAHIGPAGRVAIGFALSTGMLAGGVWLEKRDSFRNYAYGLIAGGWAGIYFTTFAMHDVPAAKVIDSDILAVSLLAVVAAGMIIHSLRYRSQVVTSLAFVVAYTTLALSPLSGFSLAASVPLAVAVLVVSQRFGWAGVSVLGIAATYGTFVVRSEVFPGGGLDRTTALPYLALGSYWLAFEMAEILALWRRHRASELRATGAVDQRPVSMLALNAVGFIGAVILTAPGDNPELFATFLFGTGAAYVVSAIIRAWIAPEWLSSRQGDTSFDSTHAATMMAALLAAVAIGLRFHGDRQVLARLLEAELLVTSGLILGDVWLRRMGSTTFALAAGQALFHTMNVNAGSHEPFAIGATTFVLALAAVAAYGNREALHRRGEQPSWLEVAFTWFGTLGVATVLVVELTPAHQALAGLVLAALLLEVVFTRSSEYLYQSHIVGVFSAYAILLAFLAPVDNLGWIPNWGVAPASLDEWLVLPAGVLVAGFATWRLWTRSEDSSIPGRMLAAGAWATLATAVLVVFEWRVLAPHAVAPAWALTALALVALGDWRRQTALRWQGYVLALTAIARAVNPLQFGPPATGIETASIVVVIALTYATAYFGRRAYTGAEIATAKDGSFEAGAITCLSVAATGSLAILKWRVLPEQMVAPAWAATGLVMLVLGITRAKLGQRLQGYALTAIGLARVIGLLVAAPSATAGEAWWAVTVIALAYTSSWLVRRAPENARDSRVVEAALPALATIALAVLEAHVFVDPMLGPVWTATGIIALALGLWRNMPDFRGQGYALVAIGAIRAFGPELRGGHATTAEIACLGGVIAALYACGIAVRKLMRSPRGPNAGAGADEQIGAFLLMGASAALAFVILREVRVSVITLALGIQGLGSMLTGLLARERVMRLSGLLLLLACILKLFVIDLRELEALARIMSFVVLGVFLLAISWTYTRYREQIQKFL